MINNLAVLSEKEIQDIQNASLSILYEVGVRVPHRQILERLADGNAKVDFENQVVRFEHDLIHNSIEESQKQHILYGRERTKQARFGYGDIVICSSAGQYSWFDEFGSVRRDPTINDLEQSILIGDALEHVNLVGAMGMPVDVPLHIRDIYMTAALLKGTNKPIHCWIANGRSLEVILDIFETVSGGREGHRRFPMFAAFIEPISPLGFSREGLEILWLSAQRGLPIWIGPMAQSGATAPVTLAGTLALENAEILAGITITQLLSAGCPVCYGGIPHVMDMREMLISFGSPEQGLMAVAMTQMAKHYGLPIYINVGLGDSKSPDAQNGLERGMTMLMGALAGGDLLGHMGICGADQGACLEQLIIDNQMIAYIKRIMRSFQVDEETLAVDLIKKVGIGGNFLAEEHTVSHFRQEIWLPKGFDRRNWEAWHTEGEQTIADWAKSQKKYLLAHHTSPPMDEDLSKEIDQIVAAAAKQL